MFTESYVLRLAFRLFKDLFPIFHRLQFGKSKVNCMLRGFDIQIPTLAPCSINLHSRPPFHLWCCYSKYTLILCVHKPHRQYPQSTLCRVLWFFLLFLPSLEVQFSAGTKNGWFQIPTGSILVSCVVWSRPPRTALDSSWCTLSKCAGIKSSSAFLFLVSRKSVKFTFVALKRTRIDILEWT